MINFDLQVPVLPAIGRCVGRIAAVRGDPWTADICDAFRHRGYEILSLPSYRHVPEDLRRQPQIHLQFSAKLLEVLRQSGPIDYLLSGNSDAIFLIDDHGRLRTLGEMLEVPTIIWWFDDPRLEVHAILQYHLLPLYPFLVLLRGETIHHFMLDRAMVAEFARDGFWPHVFHLPAAANPQRFSPAPEGAVPDNDLIMVANGYDASQVRAYVDTNLGPDWYDQVLEPILDLKRANLRRSLRELVELWLQGDLQRAGHPVVRAMQHPWQSDSFQTCYCLWKANTFLWSALRNDAVLACQKRFGDRFKLFGNHWAQLGGISQGYLVSSDEQLAWYRRSKVGLNALHGQAQTGLPFRIWELAACGLAIVTQNCAELADSFEPGVECLAFGTAEQAVVQVEWLLADSATRQAQAQAARRQLLARHQWAHRLEHILDALDMPRNPLPISLDQTAAG